MTHEELRQKAKQAKSVEELLEIAKQNNYPLTEEQAKEYFAKLNQSGELTEEELAAVSGGGCKFFPDKVGGNHYCKNFVRKAHAGNTRDCRCCYCIHIQSDDICDVVDWGSYKEWPYDFFNED